MRKEGAEKKPDTGLRAAIERAKEARRDRRFGSLVGSVVRLWYYQYQEAFHCAPGTVDDLIGGIRYLVFSRKD